MRTPTITKWSVFLAILLGGLAVLATFAVPTNIYDTSQTVSCGFPFTISSVRYVRFSPPLPYEFSCPGSPSEDPMSFSFLNLLVSFTFFAGCFYIFFLLIDIIASHLNTRRVYQGLITGLLVFIILQWMRNTAQISDLNNDIMTEDEAIKLVQYKYPVVLGYSSVRPDDMHNATEYVTSERTEDGYFIRFAETKHLSSGQALFVQAKCFRVLYFSDVDQVHLVGTYTGADGGRKELAIRTCQ